MPELQITDFTFQHRGPYTLTIPAGKIAGMQGASGAGKTLLLRAIADLDPHQGQARLGTMSCDQVPAPVWRKTVGLLSAESFWWFDTVGEHFQNDAPHLTEYLEKLGFKLDALNWEVSRLSTGEKQRLSIARLLQHTPAALLLDEPTASLDAANIECVETLLLDYCHQQQAPLLWVSHDSVQLERVADAIYFLEQDGALQQVQGGSNGR